MVEIKITEENNIVRVQGTATRPLTEEEKSLFSSKNIVPHLRKVEFIKWEEPDKKD